MPITTNNGGVNVGEVVLAGKGDNAVVVTSGRNDDDTGDQLPTSQNYADVLTAFHGKHSLAVHDADPGLILAELEGQGIQVEEAERFYHDPLYDGDLILKK
jgi:hypothetical protein